MALDNTQAGQMKQGHRAGFARRQLDIDLAVLSLTRVPDPNEPSCHGNTHQGLSGTIITPAVKHRALDNVDLTIPANRIFTLLGPSGCGKTTLLRCIVGLETPDAGEIDIGDEVVWSTDAEHLRSAGKSGSRHGVSNLRHLAPHDRVRQRGLPLQNRKIPKDDIRRKVEKILRFVQLEGFEKRPATKLCGGQQQRVALARALVAEPKVILFDEPLSNLDAKLREETRKELRSFLTELKITAVYVTHDRIEALALSDHRCGNAQRPDHRDGQAPKESISTPTTDSWPTSSAVPTS